MLTQKKTAKENDNKNNIVIVGAGPAGLSAAIMAIKKGYKVSLINKYPPAVRKQRVKIDRNTFAFFHKLCTKENAEDKKFIQKIKNTENTVSISTVERFLMRKLTALTTTDNFEYINEKIGELKSIDKMNQTCQIKHTDGSERSLTFKHIIDASGISRVALKMLADKNEKVSQDLPKINQQGQGTAVFYFNKELINPENKNTTTKIRKDKNHFHIVKFKEDSLIYLREKFGWDKPYLPRIYVIPDEKHQKFYVGGEIPDEIAKQKNNSITREWLENALYANYDIPRSVKNIFSDNRTVPDDNEINIELISKLMKENQADNTFLLANALNEKFENQEIDLHTTFGNFILAAKQLDINDINTLISAKNNVDEVEKTFARLVNPKEIKNIIELTSLLLTQYNVTISDGLLKENLKAANLTSSNSNEKNITLLKIAVLASKYKLPFNIAVQTLNDNAEKYQKKHDVPLNYAMDAVLRRKSLETTSFPLDLSQAVAPVQFVNENNHSVAVAVGDALQSPNFHYGHGLNDAIAGVVAFNNSLPDHQSNKPFKIQKMKKFSDELKETHLERMTGAKSKYDNKIQLTADDKLQFIQRYLEEIYQNCLDIKKQNKSFLVPGGIVHVNKILKSDEKDKLNVITKTLNTYIDDKDKDKLLLRNLYKAVQAICNPNSTVSHGAMKDLIKYQEDYLAKLEIPIKNESIRFKNK